MIGRHSPDDAQAFDDAWNARTSTDQEIAELVQLAESLCEAAVAEPSTQFRTDLRARLMTEAATTLVAMPGASRPTTTPERTLHPVRRRIAGLAAVLIASTGAVGLVSTSASALPGELLYPVKRSVETVELTWHRSDSSRGTFQLEQASKRLDEARALSAKNASATLITEALDSFADSAANGSTRLFSDFADSGEEQSVRKVNGFVETSNAGLANLSDQLPPSADDAYAAATEAVEALATEASSLCITCVSAEVQSLVSAVSDLAKNDPAPRNSAAKPGTGKARPSGGQSDQPGVASTPKPAQTGAAPTPVPATPALPTPTRTPSLRDVTDPLIGGLLGDEDQEGLVPGLLNGLLGNKN